MTGHTADDFKRLLTESRLRILPADAADIAFTVPGTYLSSLYPQVRHWRPILERVVYYLAKHYDQGADTIIDPLLQREPVYRWLKWATGLAAEQAATQLGVYVRGTLQWLTDSGLRKEITDTVVFRDTQALLSEVGSLFNSESSVAPLRNATAKPEQLFVAYALDGLDLTCLSDSYGANFYAYAARLPDPDGMFWLAVERRLAALEFFLSPVA